MPVIFVLILAMLGSIAIAPAVASTCAILAVLLLGVGKLQDIEEEYTAAGTPWQYRPTLWVILFLLFVGLLVGAKLS